MSKKKYRRKAQKINVPQRTEFAWVKPSGSDLEAIAQLIDKGFLRTAIDRVYALEDTRLAHEYSESGRVQGKTVIDIVYYQIKS